MSILKNITFCLADLYPYSYQLG